MLGLCLVLHVDGPGICPNVWAVAGSEVGEVMGARPTQTSLVGEGRAILIAVLGHCRRRLTIVVSLAVIGREVEADRQTESQGVVSTTLLTIGRTIAACQTKTVFVAEKSREVVVNVDTTIGPITIMVTCESPSKSVERHGPKSATAAIAICPALLGMGQMRDADVSILAVDAEGRGLSVEVVFLETKSVVIPIPSLAVGVALSDLAIVCLSQDLDFRQPKNCHHVRGPVMAVVAAPDAESRI